MVLGVVPVPEIINEELPTPGPRPEITLEPSLVQALVDQKDMHYLLKLDPFTQEFFNNLVRNHMDEPLQVIEALLQKVDFLQAQVRGEQKAHQITQVKLKLNKERYVKIYKEKESLRTSEHRMRKTLQKIKGKSCPMTLKDRHDMIRDIFKPSLTDTQISCFIKKDWCRGRWSDEDYERALILLKKSKQAYYYLRDKRILPLPSRVAILKYVRSKPAAPDIAKDSKKGSAKASAKKPQEENGSEKRRLCERKRKPKKSENDDSKELLTEASDKREEEKVSSKPSFEPFDAKIEYPEEDNCSDDDDLTPLHPNESDYDEDELEREIQNYEISRDIMDTLDYDCDEDEDDIMGDPLEGTKVEDDDSVMEDDALLPKVEIKDEPVEENELSS